MINYTALFDYFRQCPYLAEMMSIAAESEVGTNVILTQGASPAVQYAEKIDALGNYECTIIPYPSIYEDYQINCYVYYDTQDTSPPLHNSNILTLEEVRGVCDWIIEQDRQGNYPDIGEQVVSIECNPFVPQERGVDEDTNTLCYFITVRVRYVNKRERRQVYYECDS